MSVTVPGGHGLANKTDFIFGEHGPMRDKRRPAVGIFQHRATRQPT